MEKRGSVSGFPTLGSRCTDMQISYRWVYGFLIVGFQGIGWARLFGNPKSSRPLGAGAGAGLNQGPLLNRLVNLLAHPFPVKLQSVRYSAVHDDLKPPQTARRHADLLRAHRRIFQTEIPTNEKTMLL